MICVCLGIIVGLAGHGSADDYDGPVITQAPTDKHRLIILADMGNEPDELQQMVHLHMYANEVDIEGLIAVTSFWLRNNPRPDLFTSLINEYAKVVDNLEKHAPGWPSASYLHSITKAGQQGYGIADVGEGKTSPGSRLITEVVTRDDPRPVNIIVNGGSNTLAQALWDYRDTHTQEEVDDFVAKMLVHENGSQDNAGAWIVNNFPNIHWVRNNSQTYAYMGGAFRANGPYCWEPYSYSGWGQHRWANEHIRKNHGPLGEFYPLRFLGTFTLEGGGTTPWIGLVNQGLYDPAKPHWGGWGGRFTENKVSGLWSRYPDIRDDEQKMFSDVIAYDAASDRWTDPVYNKVWDDVNTPVYRWRRAMLTEFKARMDWCVKTYSEANHNPIAAFNGDQTKSIVYLSKSPGDVVKLDASASSDPDGNDLVFKWYVYGEVTTYNGELNIINSNSDVATLTIPRDASGSQLHIILEVKDVTENATDMVSYRRIVINVSSALKDCLQEEEK